jgi:hypothetical protein
MGAIGKQPEKFQKKRNDQSPSVTLMRDPLNDAGLGGDTAGYSSC